jgi:hypothetical protein
MSVRQVSVQPELPLGLELQDHQADVAEQSRAITRVGLRIGACILGAGIAAAPVALEQGIENASVDTKIADFPTTLTYTSNGESSLRLGPVNIYADKSWHGIGMSGRLNGGGSRQSFNDYFSPASLQTYAGLFKDPQEALKGYQGLLQADAVDNIKLYEGVAAGLLGLVVYGGTVLIGSRRELKNKPPLSHKKVAAVSLAAVAVSTLASGYVSHSLWERYGDSIQVAETQHHFVLSNLDGTGFEGAYADQQFLQKLTDDGLAKGKGYIRQGEVEGEAYTANGISQLEEQKSMIAAPKEDEVAILIESDKHDNQPMTELEVEIIDLNDELYGEDTVSQVVSAGDFGYDNPFETSYLQLNAKIVELAPFNAIKGNHEGEFSMGLLQDAGVSFLNGKVTEVADTTLLGMADPRTTEFFGDTTTAEGLSEILIGQQAHEIADKEHPELTIFHEAYAAVAFVGDDYDPRTFVDGGSRNYTTPYEDGVADVPTSLVAYGHWHNTKPYRVIWNSDGSWTVFVELGTAGGAIGSPKVGEFSIPYEPPKRLASFLMVFKNKTSGLITGTQLYKFYPNGRVDIDPRIDIGSPDGQPFTTPVVRPYLNNKHFDVARRAIAGRKN